MDLPEVQLMLNGPFSFIWMEKRTVELVGLERVTLRLQSYCTPQYPNSMPLSGTLANTASHGDSCVEFNIDFIILNNLF